MQSTQKNHSCQEISEKVKKSALWKQSEIVGKMSYFPPGIIGGGSD